MSTTPKQVEHETKILAETKKNSEFLTFKQMILDSTLVTKKRGPIDWSFPGNYLRYNGRKLALSKIPHCVPLWLFDENNLAEILFLLAERNATRNFLDVCDHFLVNTQRRVFIVETFSGAPKLDFMSFLMKQPETFFKQCGQLLLMSAIINSELNIVKFLLIEKEISPCFDLEQVQITNPLYALTCKMFMWENEDVICEILELLHSKGCNLNAMCSNRHSKPLDCVISKIVNLPKTNTKFLNKYLELGASPFTFCDELQGNVLKHPLTYAFHKNKTDVVEMLLSYGAGLILDKERIRALDVQVLPDHRQYPHCSGPFLSRKEIVYQNCLKENHWIYTVENLEFMLKQFAKFKPEDLRRTDTICQSVLNTAKEGLNIFAPGVVEVFRQYFIARKKPFLQLANETLAVSVTSGNVRNIILTYLEEPEVVKDSCPVIYS